MNSLSEFTQMRVFRLLLDPETNAPILILQDEASGALLPIWIGLFEAHAIALKMEGVEPKRPLTHDLLSNFFTATQSLVERIEVHDLVDNTYFSRIFFLQDNKEYAIDSRPSDAIALALRTTSPIFVANHVLEKSKIDPSQFLVEQEEGQEEKEPEWDEMLRKHSNPSKKDKMN